MDPLPTFPQFAIPRHGVVEGGLLDGWSYGFMRLVVVGNKALVDLQVTQPSWPFPHHRPVRFGAGDFRALRDPTGKEQVLDTKQLIEAALAANR